MKYVSYMALLAGLFFFPLEEGFSAIVKMQPVVSETKQVDTSSLKRAQAIDVLSDALTAHNFLKELSDLKRIEQRYKDAVEISAVDYRRYSDHFQCNVNRLNASFENPDVVWGRLTQKADELDSSLGYEISQGEEQSISNLNASMTKESYKQGVNLGKKASKTVSNQKEYSLKDLNGQEGNDDFLKWEIGRDILVDLYANPKKYGTKRGIPEFPLWEDEKYLYDKLVWNPHMEKVREYYLNATLKAGWLADKISSLKAKMQELENSLFSDRDKDYLHPSKIKSAYTSYLTALTGITGVPLPYEGELINPPKRPKLATTSSVFKESLLGKSLQVEEGTSGAYYLPLPPYKEIFYLQIQDKDAYKKAYIQKEDWGTDTVVHSELPMPWEVLKERLASNEDASYRQDSTNGSEFFRDLGDKVSSSDKNGIEAVNRISSYLDLKFQACLSYNAKEEKKAIFEAERDNFIERAAKVGLTISSKISFLDKAQLESLVTQIKARKKELISEARGILDQLDDSVLSKGINLNKVVYELIGDEDGVLSLSLQPKNEYKKELKQAIASKELLTYVDDKSEDILKDKLNILEKDCIKGGIDANKGFYRAKYWPDTGVFDGDLKALCGE